MTPKILLDNGHGIDTPGKRSPIWKDGKQLFEYEFNRDIVSRLSNLLSDAKVSHKIIVPEIYDVPLTERCRRANKEFANNGRNSILISIHANAGGGTGWECFTSIGDTKADALATYLCKEAQRELKEFSMRFDYSDKDPDKESQFYILRNTICPAILSENLFMDTERDCRFIMSDKGRDRIANLHLKGIKKMVDNWHLTRP